VTGRYYVSKATRRWRRITRTGIFFMFWHIDEALLIDYDTNKGSYDSRI
jgi:hypothetical protein